MNNQSTVAVLKNTFIQSVSLVQFLFKYWKYCFSCVFGFQRNERSKTFVILRVIVESVV